ncbi:MAG: hypothetical protein OK438_00950 [Thaumarchaeota archaeon]|nr:hypothetical protein [Nitrososphaerota archaeon]
MGPRSGSKLVALIVIMLLAAPFLALIPSRAQAAGPPGTVPVVLTVYPRGAPTATFSLSGCGVSPATIPGDGLAHTVVAESGCGVIVAAPTPGSDMRFVFPSASLGASNSTVITVGSASLISLTYYYQVGEYVSFNVIGGGSPSPVPSLLYSYVGTNLTQPLSTTPTHDWLDWIDPSTGKYLHVSPAAIFAPGSSSERWANNGTFAVKQTAGGTIIPSYHHQYYQFLSYSVTNGHSATAPFVDGSQFGYPFSSKLGTPSIPTWFDAIGNLTFSSTTDSTGAKLVPNPAWVSALQSQNTIIAYSPVSVTSTTTTSSSSSVSSNTTTPTITTTPGSTSSSTGGVNLVLLVLLLGFTILVAAAVFLWRRGIILAGDKPKGPGGAPEEGGATGTGGPGSGPGAGPGSGPGSGPGGGPGGIPVGGEPVPPPVVPHGAPEGCALSSHWLHHRLEMGLLPGGSKDAPNKFTTPPDEPVPLRAGATDVHLLIQECSCPGIAGDLSRKTISMAAKLRVEWEIVEGEGGFVDQSRGTPRQSDKGDEVLFQPGRVDPKSGSKAKTVKVRVKAVHDDTTKPPDHAEVTSLITMEISRSTAPGGPAAAAGQASKDEYLYNYWVEDGPPVKGPDPPPDMTADCVPGHDWAQAEEIQGQISLMPLSCNPGDLVRLGAMGTDADELRLVCTPSGKVCKLPSPTSGSVLSDPLTYSWKADRGDFPLKELYEKLHGKPPGAGGWEGGQVVVWRAPGEACDAKITLQMRDSGAEFPDKPKELQADVRVGNPSPSTPATPPPPTVIPPQTSKAQVGTCCGPDVTDNVLGAMLKMMNDFFSWSREKQSTELGYLTRIPLAGDDGSKPNFNNAWDITELAPSEERGDITVSRKNPVPHRGPATPVAGGYKATLSPYVGRCMNPTDPCYPSVVFLGNCHHPQVVNYIEWGVLARLDEWMKVIERLEDLKAVNAQYFKNHPEEKETASPQAATRQYLATTLGDFHTLRSGLLDANYQDQVAMVEVGWRLADDYLVRKTNGKLPYKLKEVNKAALEGILESLQNNSRGTAACKTNCGRYLSSMSFRYNFGDEELRLGIPLAEL